MLLRVKYNSALETTVSNLKKKKGIIIAKNFSEIQMYLFDPHKF